MNFIESWRQVNSEPLGVFEVTYATLYCEERRDRTLVECFTVHDEEGLRALPVGTRLIDREDHDENSYGFDWLHTDRGWRYGRAASRERGSYPYTSTDMAQRHDMRPFVVLTPSLLGEFHPEYADAPSPQLDPNDKTGYRAVLHQRKGWRAGQFHGFPVEIVEWPASGELAKVKPLRPRPDRHGLGAFWWNKGRMNVGAKAERGAA